ncbi:hypothetical protein M3J09_012429 [Ascochyta lentis]
MISFGIILPTLFLIVSIWAISKSSRFPHRHRNPSEHITTDVNGLVPDMPRQIRLFWNDSSYAPTTLSTSSDDIDDILQAWRPLMPRGQGEISVSSPSHHALPWPIPGSQEQSYRISVFAQLDLLYSIFRTILRPEVVQDNNNFLNEVLHSLDYLRQSIMCCGDTALEGVDPYARENGELGGTLGIGSHHVCKDFDAIFNYAESVRV